ncbi:TonB-dependent receptor [Sphingomonas sp. BIUV-7]|uniref:TonB-dependent receptor n=1 Tax=Sphingomonas natans TaxID=3063330 RepID=A0ABT8YAG5_9SPHN|nr:TonB-dependent receptor [Sphingomonas sp. BIUV-7]MDO6415300.1 TonB-dependent receptor [Sphingomonas sp. BIUV-7]
MIQKPNLATRLQRTASATSLAIALGCTPTVASAQSAPDVTATLPPAAATDGSPAGGIGDIIVTARRREESIQNVPISVAAFGGNTLAERQIDSADKLTQLAPNVQFSAVAPASGNSSSSAIFIRGVGQTDFLASTDPGVGFYVDGVYFARASGTAISLLDVDRVEVLRGPQGTLFGRNTVGGAIQIFSARPNFNGVSGNIGATLGDYSRRDVKGVLNLPITDTLALRFAATKRDRKGYVTNILSGRHLGDVDTFAGRASLLWKPSDKFEALLIGDYTRDSVNGSPTVFGGINTSAAFVRFASAIAGCPGFALTTPVTLVPENNDRRCANNQYLALGPYKVASEAPSKSQLEMYGAGLTLKYEPADWISVKSITAYRKTKPFSIRDADNTPLLILETVNKDNIKQFTQEVQFVGETANSRLKYLFGAYYFRETDYQFYPVFLPSQISATTGEELRVGGLNNNASIKNQSIALFTQESFAVTDKLNVTVGLRYTRDKKEATPYETAAGSGYGYTNVGYNVAYPAPLNAQMVCLGAPRTGAPAAACRGSNIYLFNPVLNSKTSSKVTPAATLQYQWTPELMTYASYSQGFKSGGFNTRIVQPVISANAPTGREFLPEFDPERVATYELGGKLLVGRTLRLSVAGFHSKYDDIQIVVREGVAPVVRNAGKATINGFEVEGTFSPISPMLINFGVGYTHFEYDSFTPALLAGQIGLAPHALGVVDLDDKQAYSPDWSLNGGVAYRVPVGQGAITPRADVAFRSKTYFDAPNTEQIAQGKYALVNISIRYQAPENRFSVAAGITNLTDKAYRGSGNSSLTASSGYAEVTYGPPRMFTVEGTYNF